MSENKHEHITYNETKKYSKLFEKSVWDNWDFLEDFNERIDNCPICSKQFRMYTMYLTMIEDELLGENIAPYGFVENDIKEKDLNKNRSLGKIIRDAIDNTIEIFFSPPLIKNERGVNKGNSTNNSEPVITVFQEDNITHYFENTKDAVKLILRENGEIKFEICKPNFVFTFKTNLNSEYSIYNLKICSADNRLEKFEKFYTMLEDESDETKVSADIYDLPVGVYIYEIVKESK